MSTHDQLQRTGWRRIAALLALALATALLLSACGDDDGEATAGGGSGTTASSGNGDAGWCGDEEVTLGIYDGGGLNAWSKESLEQVKLEADKCPAITEQIVVNAGFDPQKGVSGLRSLVAQGANAIVAIPDAGVCAELPAMRQATQRDVKVVAWAADPCGEPGTDVEDYVDWSPQAAGRLWTEWVAEQMGRKGNLLYLGGPAGNPVDAGHVKGVQEALEEYPDIELLENVTEKSWPVTNWDPAEAQKVTSALLAKHDQIDGIVSTYGATSQGALKAFQGADRRMAPIATTEQNALACAWEDAKGSDEEFELATISSRNWLGRFAVRKAVAAVNGQSEEGKSIVELPLVEDSTDPDLQPVCKPDASPEAYHSNDLPEEDFEAIVYGG
jgi:ribose transport system substrate-binding protein